MLPPAVERPWAVLEAQRLFSQTKTTGSRQRAARFTPSWNGPRLAAPSPKKVRAAWPDFRCLIARPTPGASDAARGQHAVGAEIAHGGVGDVHGAALAVTDPRHLAVELGHQPAQRAALGDEVAMAPVGREDVVVRPQAVAAPAATASWPIERWMKPGKRPPAYSSRTRSSKSRTRSIAAYSWSSRSGPSAWCGCSLTGGAKVLRRPCPLPRSVGSSRSRSQSPVRLTTMRGRHENEAGKGRDPPRAVEVLAPLVDHPAPGRRRRLDARPRNESVASSTIGPGQLERGDDHQRGDDVRQRCGAAIDPRHRAAERVDGVHELARAQHQHLGAQDARVARPSPRAR